MGTLHHVMHTGARPIGLLEFMDAIHATCKPRFPLARGIQHRRVAIAVSGGVDSMALAFLCSKIRRHNPNFKISDNPVSGFFGLVIDHGLRQGSEAESFAVREALGEMGIMAGVLPLSWSKVLSEYNHSIHPKDLPNLESVARTLRYQKLGFTCAWRNIVSLLLAHHEDDQYETVLMRLLQGHGSRGLRGMRKAQDIPECEGIFGANQSGYIDDQMRLFPFYKMTPSHRERRKMLREFRSDISRLMADPELNDSAPELIDIDLEGFYQSERFISSEPNMMDAEDGGVTVYRPLLEFSKDRLIATCLENNVPWWEDETNKDPTLTMRNAVRHLYKGYSLPKALQKPSILALSKRCERRVQAQEAEARRLLSQTIIYEFEPHAGTVTVQFPMLERRLARRDSLSPLRRKVRLLKQREIAAILMRKILALVSPESQPPVLTMLENHVSRLFPSLALSEEVAAVNPPKAFSVSGVFLVPVLNSRSTSTSGKTTGQQRRQQLSWYLSRTPYPSNLPLPRVRIPYWATKNRKGAWRISPPMPWALWDGRYWIHIEHRLPYRLVVQPFLLEHAKPFRELLTPDDKNRLAAILKRYAPGKVRYTLPAIYLEEHLDLDNVVPRPNYPYPGRTNRGEDGGEGKWEVSSHPKVLDNSKMKLVALPTLDIQIPGLEEWAWYEIRYRKVDRDTLRVAGSFHRGPFVAPRAVKKRAMRHWTNSVERRSRPRRSPPRAFSFKAK
ncbi:adenine nucleotide alpha hydrolases-like protein [Hypoxylon sp. FL0890]|nr:adenine nucleotide alpha hydrolases-like protein [Hypoxylon sp. FL0890]